MEAEFGDPRTRYWLDSLCDGDEWHVLNEGTDPYMEPYTDHFTEIYTDPLRLFGNEGMSDWRKGQKGGTQREDGRDGSAGLGHGEGSGRGVKVPSRVSREANLEIILEKNLEKGGDTVLTRSLDLEGDI